MPSLKGRIAWNKNLPKEQQPFYGRKLSEEHKRKISESHKGIKPSEETRKKMSLIRRGRKLSKEHIEKIANSIRGEKNPSKRPEVKIKISQKLRGRKILWSYKWAGESHPNWKGGIASERDKIHKSQQYKDWRISVFRRDNYTCKVCNQIGNILHPHHIKTFSQYPSLRFDVDNGITLCKECHSKTKGKEELYESFFKNLLKKCA